MSLNQSFAMDKNKTAHKGKLFHTIDFELNPNVTLSGTKSMYKKTPIGDLQINGRSFRVTLAEIERIQETLHNARETFFKKMNSGMLK